MEKVNMTIRVDKEIKDQASKLFKSLGLDLSTATNIFYRQCLRIHGIPFEIKIDEPNEETYKAIEDAQNDKELLGSFNSVEELMEELNAEDKNN